MTLKGSDTGHEVRLNYVLSYKKYVLICTLK